MHYKAFGLIFDSEIELPELIPVPDETPADVEICLGKVPQDLKGEVTGKGVLYQLNRDELRLQVNDVALYYIQRGNSITIQIEPNADPRTVRLFLLGSAIGALFHQRRLLPIHASSIETPKGAVLFMGPTGIGKSTTAASLCKRGYRLISDDISLLDFDEKKKVVVHPGFPYQKLWEDALDNLNEDYTCLSKIKPDMRKYQFPVVGNFVDKSIVLSRIYILAMNKSKAQPSLESIEGLEKLSFIYQNIYRVAFHHQMQLGSDNLSLGLSISQQVTMKLCKYEHNHGKLDDWISFIEQDFLNEN